MSSLPGPTHTPNFTLTLPFLTLGMNTFITMIEDQLGKIGHLIN